MRGKHLPWTSVFPIEYPSLIYAIYAFPAEKTSATQPFQAKIKVIPVQCIYKKDTLQGIVGVYSFMTLLDVETQLPDPVHCA